MNGIPLLDSIPVNWFIIGTSILAGVILFLILTQIPDEDEVEEEKTESKETSPDETKPSLKKKSSKK